MGRWGLPLYGEVGLAAAWGGGACHCMGRLFMYTEGGRCLVGMGQGEE